MLTSTDEIPESLLLERFEWWRRATDPAQPEPTLAEVEEHFDVSVRPEGADGLLELLLQRRQQLGPRELLTREISGPSTVRATFRERNGHVYVYDAFVASTPPFRLLGVMRTKQAREGATFRQATDTDDAALRTLDAVCPIVLDDEEITIEHDDWFRQLRLMDEWACFVAEIDGEVVGANLIAAVKVGTARGDDHLSLVARTRMHPDHRKGGVYSTMNGLSGKWAVSCGRPFGIGYVHERNVRMREMMRESGFTPWRVQVVAATIDCRDAPGTPTGRRAGSSDAERVATLMNRTHGGTCGFVARDARFVDARLSRDPSYSWSNVRIGERAFVGVWDDRVTVTRSSDGRRTRTRRATVLDYGFDAGAEPELASLLRSWRDELARDGIDELRVFTSVAAPGFDAIVGLASRLDRYNVHAAPFFEPTDSLERGMYVDPIYF